MDTTKPPSGSADQDNSEDLIAELARLVAKDARGEAAPAPDGEPDAPVDAPSPPSGEPVMADPVTEESTVAAEASRQEPSFDVVPEAPQPAPEPVTQPQARAPEDFEFDFGFGTSGASQTAREPAADPIADLIVSAEEDAYAASLAESADRFEDEPVAAGAFLGDGPSFSRNAGETPAAGAESDDRDPLREIEALIGEAARASADMGPMGARRVRSAFLSDSERAAAEAADATLDGPAFDPEPQAYGPDDSYEPADAGFAEPETGREADPEYGTGPDFADEGRFDPEPVAGEEPLPPPVATSRRERRRAFGGILVPALLGTLILAGAGGIYWVFFGGESDPGDAPVLVADGEPFKEEPEAVDTASTANQSVVFNELDGLSGDGADEALVSRDQTDGVTGNAVSTVLAPEEGEIALANRRVRTVTVRPDGTIVTGEETAAGGNVLPVDRPDVPPVPNSTLTTDPIGEAITTALGPTALAENEATPGPQQEAPDAAPAAEAGPEDTPGAPEADEAAPVDPENDEIPRPIPRPTTLSQITAPSAAAPAEQPLAVPLDQPAAEQPLAAPLEQPAADVPQDVAVLQPDATPQLPEPVVPAAQGPVGAWVQLSSQRTEEVARQSMAELQTRYGTLFGGAQPEVSQVDLAERGIYYRVRLPQPTLAAANSVCQSIQAQGGDCFVMSN